MDALYVLFRVVVVGVSAVGAWMAAFNRQFSEGSLRFRKAVWKMGYSDTDIRVGRVYGTVLGIVLMGGAVIVAIQTFMG